MLNKHIYKAGPGEGKTRWLVENAIDATIVAGSCGVELYYIGSPENYQRFQKLYEEIMHSICPIELWKHKDMVGCDEALLFTDDLMHELNWIPLGLPEVGTWYITMDSRDFYNM